MRVYNPEGSTLRKDQLEMLKVLKRFDEICKENNITWWLCSGTLLGAARHGGFIPWDDDVDISMLRKDYKKLRKILAKYEDDDYFYQCIESDPAHINLFGKFRKKKDPVFSSDIRSSYFKYQGVGMDVFSIERSTRFAAHMAKSIYKSMVHPTQYIKNAFWRTFVTRTIQALNFGLLIPICRVIGWFGREKKYYYELGSGFYGTYFQVEDIFPLTTMKFEGVEFPVPGNYEAYLTKMYGDWRKLPTEQQIKNALHYPIYRKEIFGEE